MMYKVLFVYLVFLISILKSYAYLENDRPCAARKFNHSSMVCVCNSTYCDDISKVEPLRKNEFVAYYSTMDGLRFKKITGKMILTSNNVFQEERPLNEWFSYFMSRNSSDVELKIYRKKQFQEVFGFGGAFTDSTGVLYRKLSKGTQDNFINSYFSSKGIEYNMARVPIGGTDFSPRPYAYNMKPENDTHLSNFSLTNEDFLNKIPLIHRAMEVSENEILFMAASWSPPKWMKSNSNYGGSSRLLKKYYQTYADYHIRFLEEYEKRGINFWSISTGNEPSAGVFNVVYFNSLGWTPETQAEWIANNYGPTIRKSRFSKINLILLDDQIFCLPWCIEDIAKNKKAFQYIDGISVHNYWNAYFPVSLISQTHYMFPHLFILGGEASIGIEPWITEKVQLGSWERAEIYARDIINCFRNWCSTWIDWSLALDRRGGPTWYKNYVEGAVIVMPEYDEFYKQPIFYAQGHFSKFIPRGSKRIFIEEISGSIPHVGFIRPDKGIVVVFYNPFDYRRKVTIHENGKGVIHIDVPQRSIFSVLYW